MYVQSLDIDYTVLLATHVPVIFDSVGDSTVDGFFDMNDHLLGLSSTPSVFTTSYGFFEDDFNNDQDIAK